MEYHYLQEPLDAYVKKVADRTPCPGGGSVAALAAALSCALAGMVGNFTRGKKGYEAVQEEIASILAEESVLRERLAFLVEEDSAVYGRIRETPKEDAGGQKRLLKESALLHIEIAESALRILRMNEILLAKGNRFLLSDVGISAVLAGAALRSARVNVAVNMSYLDDAAFTAERTARLDMLEREALDIERRIYRETMDRLSAKSRE